jgi:hypothetical protein
VSLEYKRIIIAIDVRSMNVPATVEQESSPGTILPPVDNHSAPLRRHKNPFVKVMKFIRVAPEYQVNVQHPFPILRSVIGINSAVEGVPDFSIFPKSQQIRSAEFEREDIWLLNIQD